MKLLSVVAMVAIGLAGCKKDTDSGELPKELQPRKANVDPSKITMAALFEQVPADAPYVLASLEPVPLEYIGKWKDAFGPLIAKNFFAHRSMKKDNPVLDAVLAELDGKWNADGFESLGFSAQPHWAVYGLDGLLPVVARLEIKDGKTVRATIERIAKKAGETLPDMLNKDGHDYWRISGTFPDKPDLIVAIEPKQIVFAVGRPADLDPKLDLVLGIAKPSSTMSDGKRLKEVMSAHGFGPHIVGYADTQKVAASAIALSATQLEADCTAEIKQLAAKAPRFAFGYGELSSTRTSFGMVLELAPDAIAALQKLKTEVPGMMPALADEPMFAIGGGIDIDRAMGVAQDVVGVMRRLGDACKVDSLAEDARSAARKLDKPLPDFVAHLRGGVISVTDLEFGAKRGRRGKLLPEKVEGFAMLSTTDGKELYDALLKEQPMIDRLGIKRDGSLHVIGDGMLPLDFDVFGGVGDRALVIAAGNKGKAMGNKAIDAKGSGVKAPLFAASYDYGKFMKLQTQLAPLRSFDDDLDKAQDDFDKIASMLGRATATVDVTDKGLVLWGSIDVK